MITLFGTPYVLTNWVYTFKVSFNALITGLEIGIIGLPSSINRLISKLLLFSLILLIYLFAVKSSATPFSSTALVISVICSF